MSDIARPTAALKIMENVEVKRQKGLESDIKKVIQDWDKIKNHYALYALNPFFRGFKELLDKEKNQKPGETASYSSLELYKMLAGINKNFLDDEYFKKAIEWFIIELPRDFPSKELQRKR